MKRTVEEKIENDINYLLTDMDIIRTLTEQLFDIVCGGRDAYEREMFTISILLNRLSRQIRRKTIILDRRVFKYIHSKKEPY